MLNSRVARPRAIRALLLAVLFALSSSAGRADPLLVFAAASLSDALAAARAEYVSRGGPDLLFSFGGSSALARQIEAGAAADIFFSADEQKMDQLAAKGLILEETRRTLLSNTLVLVTSKEDTTTATPSDLLSPRVERIALAEPETVPAGIYAKTFLIEAGLWSNVLAKVTPTENVRAALAAVKSGNADAGIVFRTDALSSPGVRVAYDIPPESCPSMTYPVAVIAESPHVEAAKDFVRFLASPEAADIFKKFGFIPTTTR